MDVKDTTPIGAGNVFLPHGNPSRSAAVRLFCFHHAGGNASIYKDWQRSLAPHIHVCPVEIPGHGTRMREQPLWRMSEIIDGMETALAPWLSLPFAFFGHSMGAVIAFELTHRVRAQFGIQPERLFVSGRRGVGRPAPPSIHHLPQADFIAEIRRLNGTPEELLSHPDLIPLLSSMLRADFAVIETLEPIERTPLTCPMVAFGGTEDDKISAEDIDAWRAATSGAFAMHMLPGDHFFLNRSRGQLLQILSKSLLAESPATRAPEREAMSRKRELEARIAE